MTNGTLLCCILCSSPQCLSRVGGVAGPSDHRNVIVNRRVAASHARLVGWLAARTAWSMGEG